MAQSISKTEKFRQQFYAYLKKEDIDYVNSRSKKTAVDLYRKNESAEDPWLQCFFLNDNEIEKFSGVSAIRFASSKNIRNDQIFDAISHHVGIADDEINYCKAAMRREARAKHLPNLSSKPDDLQFLFLKYHEKFPENCKKQRKLDREIVCNMMNFEVALENCLDVLKSLEEITGSADTIEVVTANMTKMRCMMQEIHIFADLVTDNLCAVVEKFEKYQDFDVKMDRDLFSFLSHFFSYFLIPRSMLKRK